ncbi:unnamed protein product [Clonostachys rosea]|uniref:Major facilitator superfamily (MFS) profile domain-containing protein n=1 Tax=Bionectria ochroleuca TaxID=29856 RepID=A0ABY6UGQ4_BIOOC|nr:unnamed protein product [Clonostachys rosea]
MSANAPIGKDLDKDVSSSVAAVSDDYGVGEVIPTDINVGSEVGTPSGGYQPGTEAEKKLLRKIDLYLLPMLWVMCVLAYIDRNNIGNADAAGMSKDIGMSDTNYSMLITIFFIAYCSWEVPSNLILARVRPSYYVPGLMIVWGAIVCVMAEVKTYEHILVCRFFLGIIEAGFFPGVLYIFTCWYKRDEIGKRWCFFYTALCVSGAASGLISGAVISGLEGANGRKGWRWLFLIEGIVTMVVAVVAWFVLPDYPHVKSRHFTEEQRQLAIIRIKHDRQEDEATSTKKLTALESVKAAVVDLRAYLFILLFMMQNGSTTVSYFIPTVLASMGYSGVQKQWMTVPIWATGIVFLLIFPTLSDRTGNRQWFIVGGLSTAFISSVVCVSQQHNVVRYVFLCFYIAGLYTTLPLILNWASETMNKPAEKRAVIIAMVNCVGSISSIYGGYLWPSADAPKYTKGFATVSTFIGIGVILAIILPFLIRLLPKTSTKAEREIAALEE